VENGAVDERVWGWYDGHSGTWWYLGGRRETQPCLVGPGSRQINQAQLSACGVPQTRRQTLQGRDNWRSACLPTIGRLGRRARSRPRLHDPGGMVHVIGCWFTSALLCGLSVWSLDSRPGYPPTRQLPCQSETGNQNADKWICGPAPNVSSSLSSNSGGPRVGGVRTFIHPIEYVRDDVRQSLTGGGHMDCTSRYAPVLYLH
jgi:hypothetical protein